MLAPLYVCGHMYRKHSIASSTGVRKGKYVIYVWSMDGKYGKYRMYCVYIQELHRLPREICQQSNLCPGRWIDGRGLWARYGEVLDVLPACCHATASYVRSLLDTVISYSYSYSRLVSQCVFLLFLRLLAPPRCDPTLGSREERTYAVWYGI